MLPHDDKASRPPAPPFDLFNEALQFLDLQTYPPAPELVFTGEDNASKSESPQLNFDPVWKHFEEASNCKSVEDRLGKDAWVLKYAHNAVHEESEDKEELSAARLSEEETVVAEDSEPDFKSAGSFEEKSPTGLSSTATLSESTALVPSAVTVKTTRGLPKAPSAAPPLHHKKGKLQPLSGNPTEPLLVPTSQRVYITTTFNASPAPVFPPHRTISPLTYETHFEKKQQIARKLYRNLAQERDNPNLCPVLGISPSPPYPFVRSVADHGGLHVFIDISNIYLGFKDCLKRSRRMSYRMHVSQPPFNFTDFAFILERGRPTTRRILVGSCAKSVAMPYHVEATSSGYEVNTLERVPKARLPPGKRVDSPGGYASASDSSATGAHGNFEQGVDEILQMKILESIVDTDEPSTIVLATGDAAVAEFSGGFLVSVKRALLKGWKVEVVGWRDGMSQAFVKLAKKMDKQDELRGMLRIITLDDMAEDLLAWYRPE